MEFKEYKLDRHTGCQFQLNQMAKDLENGWKVFDKISDERYTLYILSKGYEDIDVGKTNES